MSLDRAELAGDASAIVPLSSVTARVIIRDVCELGELDAVFGGGVAVGARYLLTGGPGAGKSSLSLFLASKARGRALYCAHEETREQVAARAAYLHLDTSTIDVLSVTEETAIVRGAKGRDYRAIVIDSASSLERAGAAEGLVGRLAHKLSKVSTVFFLVHVTKAGMLRGDKSDEHDVDGVCVLDWPDPSGEVREFFMQKNRYGATGTRAKILFGTAGLLPFTPPPAPRTGRVLPFRRFGRTE